MTYIEEATKQAGRLAVVIDNDPKICKATKRITTKYIDFLKAKGLSHRTLNKRLFSLAVFYKTIGGIDVSRLTKDDMIKSMAVLEQSGYAQTTKSDIKITIKSLMKHEKGDDEFYPPEVRWIKTAVNGYKKILPESVLTEDDVLKVMGVMTEPRDKAIVSLLYDGGLRIGELIAMKFRDVDLNSEPAHVTVPNSGKTGGRQIPVFFSANYLGAYVNNLPKDKEPDSPLWMARGRWSNTNKSIDRAAVAKVLKMAAKKAGIKKAVNPHAWRKASATRYANSLTDQQLKLFYGWTESSRMPEVYVSLSGRNIDNAVKRANGIKIEEEAATTKLKSKMCPKCQYANGTDLRYCGRCGSALDIKTSLEEQKHEGTMKEAVAEALKDPKVIEEVIHSYLMMQGKIKK
jgi:site-specific recombinase XerD/ribosomal protein S27AE